jgi:hypothetical protein
VYAMRSLYRHDVPIIYKMNDQALLQRMMLKATHGPAMTHDFQTSVCLNLFSATPQKNLLWRNHSLVSKLTGTAPAVVHHNGGCGRRGAFPGWMDGYHAHTLDCHVQLRHTLSWRAHGNTTWSSGVFERRFNELIRFTDPLFSEVNVQYKELCGYPATPAQRVHGCAEGGRPTEGRV